MDPESLANATAMFYLGLVSRGVPDYNATLLTQTYIAIKIFDKSDNVENLNLGKLFNINYGGKNEDPGK